VEKISIYYSSVHSLKCTMSDTHGLQSLIIAATVQ